MVSEILPNVSIGVQSPKFPHYLHRDDLTIGQAGGKASFPNRTTLVYFFEEIIHTAENGDNKP